MKPAGLGGAEDGRANARALAGLRDPARVMALSVPAPVATPRGEEEPHRAALVERARWCGCLRQSCCLSANVVCVRATGASSDMPMTPFLWSTPLTAPNLMLLSAAARCCGQASTPGTAISRCRAAVESGTILSRDPVSAAARLSCGPRKCGGGASVAARTAA